MLHAFTMRARSSLVFVVAFLAAWALALAPRVARAQTTSSAPSVTGIAGAVQRLEPDGVTSADNPGETPHPNGVLVNDINFQDCQANLQYEFDLLISSLASGYLLNVWAGTQDCSQLANRQAATAVCWEVTNAVQPNSNPYPIKVRMEDIVSQIFETTHTVTYAAAAQNVCQFQTTTGETAITLYFFFTDGAGNPYNNVQPYPLNVDMRAGDVQGPISLGVGETLLIVNVPPTTDPDTQGWNIYCDPPPGKETAVPTVPVDAATNNGVCVPDTGVVVTTSEDSGEEADASDESGVDSSVVDSAVPVVLDDAGGNACGVPVNDAGIPSPGGCSASTVLVPGGGSTGVPGVTEAGVSFVEDAATEVTDEAGVSITGGNMIIMPPGYLCGTGGVASTQVNVLGLKDGDYYNIAAAAVDAFGNVGPLSNVPCGEPVPVNDFWKLYSEAGGQAGGGYCSTEGVGTPAGASGLGALMLASMVALTRRRRRK